jgi:NAD(P)-dependent dehydrogenase (short-subunit alcohol dehydrogenase family)
MSFVTAIIVRTNHNYYQNKNKKVAVMTRAAKGVGKEIAIEFARAGYTIMINAVKEHGLKQAAVEILSSLSPSTFTGNMNNSTVDHTSYVFLFSWRYF